MSGVLKIALFWGADSSGRVLHPPADSLKNVMQPRSTHSQQPGRIDADGIQHLTRDALIDPNDPRNNNGWNDAFRRHNVPSFGPDAEFFRLHCSPFDDFTFESDDPDQLSVCVSFGVSLFQQTKSHFALSL